ncbi:hypothetical protein BU23DRAFT_560135 [Bimuria novae-zelandiae CBS 107.79]|uniref:Uncharacterized protein n=1 Tax=Bimuria novae-zelandiae CBS 107.79 TaxID=1447943 RepID=A0A6A5UUF9_9PLEO|nr:hypothetical protein BU23DRAFT_560135 [Bimuria novae-zelandiae CBS 107.79]
MSLQSANVYLVSAFLSGCTLRITEVQEPETDTGLRPENTEDWSEIGRFSSGAIWNGKRREYSNRGGTRDGERRACDTLISLNT